MFEFVIIPLLLAIATAVICGVVGTLTVVRSNTYVAGAVSHTILAGLGFAQYSNVTGLLPFYISPEMASLITAIVVAIIISFLQYKGRMRKDSSLSAVWAIGMAIGLFFMTITPGYQTDLLRYMFGSIAVVTASDVWFVSFLAFFIVVCCICFWRGIVATCFNSDLLRLNGGKAFFFELVISIISAIAIVALVKTVGIVLVIALITLPAIAALGLHSRLTSAMVLSALFTFMSLAFGVFTSIYCDIEAAAPSVVFAAMIVFFVWLIRRINKNEKN